MIALFIALGILATVANATADEIRFHWDRLFGHWFKKDSNTEKWFNPSKSWENKYISKSPTLTFLFSTVLVWTTDFWHLLKSITLTCLMLNFLFIIFPDEKWWSYLFGLALLKLLWGIVYETTQGIYGAMSDKYIK